MVLIPCFTWNMKQPDPEPHQDIVSLSLKHQNIVQVKIQDSVDIKNMNRIIFNKYLLRVNNSAVGTLVFLNF